MSRTPPPVPSSTAPATGGPVPRPPVVTGIAAVWGLMMLGGAVAGVYELVDLVGSWGRGDPSFDLGLSLGGGGAGFLAWRGLLSGRPAAWRTVRRIAWVAAPAFAIAAVLLFVVDPSTITLSGPTGERGLTPDQQPIAVALAAAGAVFFAVQAVLLGRADVRAWFDRD